MKLRKIGVLFALLASVLFATYAQINATGNNSAGTAFGTAIGTPLTIVPAVQGSAATGAIVHVSVSAVVSAIGTSCGAGSNTATPTLAWKGPGGTSETLALSAVTASANGTLDTNANSSNDIAVQMGSAITLTTASTLASSGCSPAPQYTIYWRAF
jgi:hypothetical protein